jgi:GTPase SAR1 family protein
LRDGSTINAQLWDSASTERYRTITPICYRNLDAVLIVFDITISNLIGIHKTGLTSEKKKGEEKVILVGNKNDN